MQRSKESIEIEYIKRSKVDKDRKRKKGIRLKFLKDFRVILYVNYSYYITLHVIKGHFHKGKVYKGVDRKKI
jgi:hypothetical protein